MKKFFWAIEDGNKELVKEDLDLAMYQFFFQIKARQKGLLA